MAWLCWTLDIGAWRLFALFLRNAPGIEQEDADGRAPEGWEGAQASPLQACRRGASSRSGRADLANSVSDFALRTSSLLSIARFLSGVLRPCQVPSYTFLLHLHKSWRRF